METKVEIYYPIEIIDSEQYKLVIKDAKGIYHYFLDNGEYDGYSRDCDNCEIED